jgi:hypothetical protein
MSAAVATEARRETLTDYEAGQVRRIAAWKSEPPSPFSEMFKRLTLPGARFVERRIPDRMVEAAIDRSYDAADRLAAWDLASVCAGVSDPGASLEECDRRAERVGTGATIVSAAEGAATGAGGVLTTLIDIPLLFILSLRTIVKIGRCYGYPLDKPGDRRFVLGVLIVATSGSLAVRRERLYQLREIEEWLLEETQEEVLAEELASLLFQLEVFEGVPGVGAVSGAVLNLAFLHKVETTARRVFQERWLRDRGKVSVIEPAETHARALAIGWSGALSRAAYSSCYAVGFGMTLPVWLAIALFPGRDTALARGLRDGAAAARDGASRLIDRLQGAPAAPEAEPSLASA